MATANLYYSFRSPYSYLGSWRYLQLTRDHDLEIRLCPVYPAAIRFPGFFKQRNPLFALYLTRDVARVAEMTGVPCKRPDPDPVQFKAPGEAADDQPYIYRLTWMGLEAARRGRGLEWAAEIGKTLWSDHVTDWHLGDHLAEATARAGLDLGALEAAIEGRDADLDAEVKANQAAEEEAGHWGAPVLVIESPEGPEPFFGQDRIDMAIWWMRERGILKRTG